MRSHVAVSFGVAACLVSAGLAASALAQLDRGTRARALDAFDGYDLDGLATLEAIRELSPTTPAGQRMGGVPRLARARAATDFWLLSWMDPARADLERRVAEALGVPSFAVESTLLRELEVVDQGALREDALELQQAIALRRAIEAGDPVSLSGVRGVRRDALLVHLVGRALEDGDDAELAEWMDDPCADPRACDAPWSGWAPPSRAVVASLVEAAAALERLDAAWWDGDPFARAVLPALHDDERRLELHVHAPAPLVPGSLPLAFAPYDDGVPAQVALLVVAGADRVRVERIDPVGVRDGRLTQLEPGEGVLPASIELQVPRARGEGPAPLPELVERLRAIELAPGAVVAIGVDERASAERLRRVLASMVQAQRAPSLAVRQASDGTLRAVPIQVVDAFAAGAPGDLVVEVRRGGLDARPPLQAPVGPVPTRRWVVRAVEPLPASAVVDAAFQVAQGGDQVALVGR